MNDDVLILWHIRSSEYALDIIPVAKNCNVELDKTTRDYVFKQTSVTLFPAEMGNSVFSLLTQ